MEGAECTVLDVLRVLPVDAQAAVFGGAFSRRFAGCRLVCRELRELHDRAIKHVRLRPPVQQLQQQAGLASPLAKFPGCSRLSLEVAGGFGRRSSSLALGANAADAPGGIDPIRAALAGTTLEARLQITILSVRCARGWEIEETDRLRVAEAAAVLLPALAELELRHGDGSHSSHREAGRRPQGGVCGILGPRLPALRRLTLWHATDADLVGLGAVAASWPQLQELALPMPLFIATDRGIRRMRAAMDGLAQLQRLERLTLCSHAFCRGGGPQLLASLLAGHWPPQLRTLVLLGSGHAPVVAEVDFAPTGLCAQGEQQASQASHWEQQAAQGEQQAAQAAGWGMSRIQLHTKWMGAEGSLLVSSLLAAADSLRQLSIPQLLLANPSGSWMLGRDEFKPEAAWPRLLARCARVDVDLLPSPWIPGFYGLCNSQSAAALPAARLMGLPRALELQHGTWLCRGTALGTRVAPAAAAGTATPGTPAHQLPREEELGRLTQKLHLGAAGGGRSTGGAAGGDGGGPMLHLDTAWPGEVLREAVERLWAEAARAGGEEAATAAGGDDAIGAGRSIGSIGSSGHIDGVGRLRPGLLLLRGPLPPGLDLGVHDADWAGWLYAALRSCFAAAGPMGLGQGPSLAYGRWRRLPDSVSSRVRRGRHIAVPAADVLLLNCRSRTDAQALAARVPAAAGGAAAFRAIVLSRDAGRSATRALKSRVFQVLMDMWARSGALGAAGGGAGGGTASGGGGGGGSSSSRTGGAQPPGASRLSEEVLGRLQRLLDLDAGVRQLWSGAELGQGAVDEDDGDEDGGCYGYRSDGSD
ncbi:hypothetical protein HXX76_015817 [Chlamydomonas incerta]|uniref:Uncharacterized protein n=1 Tax=Chlamydomonas incerta TaxID=51695 RepID=A0A835SL96_CHLIN|nr:hypothetical protein HXX76_015817 [Chlamydomonas incerta]|eukprot:KAG2422730.1 hypothetical protein HXX76_015817 [Chlamydomonas incerta]